MALRSVKKEDDVMITLKVQKDTGFLLHHETDTPLQELMIAYCERRQLGDYRTLRFHVDGDRVRDCQTP